MVALVALTAALLWCNLASAQVFKDEPELPAECVWTGDSCAAIATGPDAALYHQVTENFEACFSSTVVKGEYVQRYSGCDQTPPKATCKPFFAVPLQLCLPDTATWASITDMQDVLRLLIECEDAAVVSARSCDTFRADLYNGLQCPQCVAPANAVAAASAVCEAIPTAAQCLPDAAGGAEFEDHTVLGDAIAPAPGGLVLGDGGGFGENAPLAVDLPGGGFDGAFPAGVPEGALVPVSADNRELMDTLDGSSTSRSSSDPGELESRQAPAPEGSTAHSPLQPFSLAVGAFLLVVSLL